MLLNLTGALMRTLMLMAAAAGLAAAQDSPKPPAEPPKAEEKAAEKKPEGQLPAPFRQKQVCAIPLLNVLKPAPGAATVRPDPMIIVPRGPAAMKENVQVPAPSCDDVKDVKKEEVKK